MSLEHALTAFFASFVTITMRVIQQQNVIHRMRKAAAFTSFLIAFGDVMVVTTAVKSGFLIAIPIGAGGAAGAVLAMALHDKLRALYDRT